MNTKIFYVLILSVLLFGMIRAQAAGSGDQKATVTEVTFEDGDAALEQLQGGNDDLFIVIFYVDQANANTVKSEIASRVPNEANLSAKLATVDLTKVQDYYKLLRVLKLEGEPKRGHTEPQVLVMKKGEGIIIRGPKITDGIIKRISRVQDGSLFGQSGNTPDSSRN